MEWAGSKRTLAAALVGGAAASLAACGPGAITAKPTAADRFAYAFQTAVAGPDGEPGEQVRLARIVTGLKPPMVGRPPDPTAADAATLLDTATKTAPTDVTWIGVSPKNTRLLVYTTEVPLQALDHNLQVWNVATGSGGALFNEHSAAGKVNKTTCPSAVFKQYVDTAYADATPAEKDAITFSLAVEGEEGANVPAPQILGWIDEQKVALKWKFRLQVSDGAGLDETFDMILTWPTGGGAPTMVCAPAPAIPTPSTVLTADPTIRLRGKPVKFAGSPRNALKIAGVIFP